MAQVRVEGLNQLVRDFKRVGGDVAELKEELVPIGEKVAKRARVVVPKGATRRLGKSIRVSKAQRSVTVRAGGGSASYAPFVAFGSRHNPAPVRFLSIALADTDVSGEVLIAINRIMDKAGF